MGNKMEYENRVVCFLDILGFKNIIEESEKDSLKLQYTLEALEILNTYKTDSEQNYGATHESVQVTQFSDSIVVSFLLEERDQLILALIDLQVMIVELINYGFLLRGGISSGNLIHTSDVLIGTALHEAYQLESSIAIYPRIIISQQLINDYLDINNKNDDFGRNFEESDINNLLLMSDDGYYMIDYFFSVKNIFDNEYYYVFYLQKMYHIISNGCKSKNNKVNVKFKWMKEKYNYIVNQVDDYISKLDDVKLKEKYKTLKPIN